VGGAGGGHRQHRRWGRTRPAKVPGGARGEQGGGRAAHGTGPPGRNGPTLPWSPPHPSLFFGDHPEEATITRPARSQDRLLTIEEYQNLPHEDGYRDELVRGRLVREPRPARLHGRVQARLLRLLDEFVEPGGLGHVFGEAGFILADAPSTVWGPDLSFVSRARMPDADARGDCPGG
jgi:hypothetical protein